ncbi:MAG: CHASE2 domain-containing protein [Gammaproteobacteria bacterium]|nr:CHASE2 domain-containing protein [Gammaproteobacteria bacterium]
MRLLFAVCLALSITALIGQTVSYRQMDLWLAENIQQPLIAKKFHFTDTVIVDVNEESMARLAVDFGPWPYQRDIYDLVTGYLKDAGAKSVVYDILFSEPRGGDERFATAIQQAGNVVLPGVALPLAPRRDAAYHAQLSSLAWPVAKTVRARRWDDITLPRAEFTPPDPVVKFGVINVVPDPEDGILRRVPLLHETYGRHLPTLALAALFTHQPYPEVSHAPAEGMMRVGQYVWPVTGKGEVLLQHPANRDAFPVMPFYRLVFAALGAPGYQIDPAELRGKTVFVGSTTAVLGDHVPTPQGTVPGLHILALTYQNLAQNLVLRPPRFGWNLLLTAIGIAFPLLAWHRRFQRAFSMTLLTASGMALIYLISLGLLALLKQQSALLFALSSSFTLYLILVLSRLKTLYDEKQRLYYEKQAAEEANQLKSKFLSHITHELRTPLTAIMGFNRLIGEDRSLSAPSRKYVKTVDQNSEHLLRLINNLLDQAKIEAGQMELDIRPTAIRNMIDKVIEALEIQAATKGLELKADYDTALPPGLMIDGFRLRQILINLTGNALRFTAQGHIHLKASWENDWLAIAVEDTGPGMPQQALDRIFESFQQADTSVAATHGGTGLGLTISRNLAHLMGGTIAVESTLGKGSTFLVRLPAPRATLPGETTASAAPPVAEETLTGRVLLADDSEDARALFMNYFSRWGLDALYAENGGQAVEMALAEQPDMVLMDIEMPDMGGEEALKRLRRQGYTQPVVALTAHAGQDMHQALIDAGFDGCLPKPIKREALRGAIAAILQK